METGALTRREILQLMGAGGVALTIGGCGNGGKPAAPGGVLDVAIVGGGVAGLYIGWSLLNRDAASSHVLRPLVKDSTLKVALFESDRRFGGRLYTIAPPEAPHLIAEMGGMRVLRQQQLLSELIGFMGLPTVPFPFGNESNLNYLRNVRFTLKQMLAAAPVVPYHLRPGERHLTAGGLLIKAILKYLPNAPDMSDADWIATKKTLEINGKPLVDQPMRELIQAALSSDGFDLVDKGNGYRSFAGEQNAADTMQFLTADFNKPEYYGIGGGYATLPAELASRFTRSGGLAQAGARVKKIERTSTNGEPTIRLVVDVQGRTVAVQARHVVLALPPRSIQLMDQSSFPFSNRQFVKDLNAVVGVPASKLVLSYRRAWWDQLGFTSGRSVTDLPIGQCLYFGTEGSAKGGQAGNQNSLLKATYNDDGAVAYFERFLRNGTPFESQGNVPSGLLAPQAMVQAVQPQLAKVHGIDPPKPYWAAFKDWSGDPYGGGWHFWRAGQRSYEVMPRIRKPISDANLYVCGEAWSTEQGWVQGSLATSEHVLQDHFVLPRPYWLSPGASLSA